MGRFAGVVDGGWRHWRQMGWTSGAGGLLLGGAPGDAEGREERQQNHSEGEKEEWNQEAAEQGLFAGGEGEGFGFGGGGVTCGDFEVDGFGGFFAEVALADEVFDDGVGFDAGGELEAGGD